MLVRSPSGNPPKPLQLTRVRLDFDRVYYFLLFPSTITIMHMVVNNAKGEEPTIESVPCDSRTVELKPPFDVDLNLLSWYNPAKSYGVRLFPEVLQVTHLNHLPPPIFSVNMLEGSEGQSSSTRHT
jgi:hypothetical protein